mgnify:CR=1 FL=1|jgi:hypothetical protein
MARRPHPKRLLVEGRREQFVIPHLIDGNGIPWGQRESPIVEIEEFNGVQNLLAAGAIEATFKSSGVTTVGVLVDADDDLDARWQAVRGRVISLFPNVPRQWPGTALIESNSGGQKLGVWIMPDNSTSGMIESFLQYLAPTSSEDLLDYARQVCVDVSARGAPFKDAHRAKAEIYTWLAWQDEPGRPLELAVKERILDPSSAQAASFVQWFRDLFEV